MSDFNLSNILKSLKAIKVLVVLILIGLIVSAFAIKPGYFQKSEQVSQPPVIQEVEEPVTVPEDDKVITIDTILADAREIVKWESDEYSRATILWDTEKEELKLEGAGYLFGDALGSTTLNEKHDALKVYLRDIGFEYDMYNVGNSLPGSERSILKLNDIGCELYIRDVEMKGGTDMGFLCIELPEEVTNAEPTPMSEKRARSIAETSSGCVEDGPLKDTAFYNENSKTWWIDLDIDKPGCNPACVISEDEHVEINWRCIGLITE